MTRDFKAYLTANHLQLRPLNTPLSQKHATKDNCQLENLTGIEKNMKSNHTSKWVIQFDNLLASSVRRLTGIWLKGKKKHSVKPSANTPFLVIHQALNFKQELYLKSFAVPSLKQLL